MRLHRLILSLLLFAVLGEPLWAASPTSSTSSSSQTNKKLTPAQKKREAAKRKAEKKKAAKKAAAEKKRIAKAKAAKKQRIKDGKPLLYVYSYDLQTGERLPATHITLQDVKAKPNKKPKINKPTDKHARVYKSLPAGRYWLQAAKIGYFTTDTIYFDHREDEDSIVVSLYPELRITFTVTDSLTSRPVAANIVVRNPEQHKVMQTTSDSIHSTLALLMDDRVPFYTIDATAIDYFPFHDTIFVTEPFDGVVMSPKIVKSFVLHNIYFATGKTRILETSEPALLELYQFLSSRPDRRIRIVGHTDNIGSDRSNQTLSEGRCNEVRRSMINRGIQADRIEVEGRGERDPIVPNTSEENRQMNRRVEIVLL
jgi:outer membrane protein OmpA-like peptidoglycan-associated protein